MRVLSKPELKHSIVFNELHMVLVNFGVPEDDEEGKPTVEEVL
jgi:hypothetical protein